MIKILKFMKVIQVSLLIDHSLFINIIIKKKKYIYIYKEKGE